MMTDGTGVRDHARDKDFAPGDQRARMAVSAGLEERIEALKMPDSRRRLYESSFFVLLFLLGACLNLTALSSLPQVWAYAALLVGTACGALGLNAIVLLMHEGMHQAFLPQPFWNRWISVCFGGLALVSFSAYQVMHLRHHRYLGDRRDPDDYHNYSASPGVVWMMHYMRLLAGSLLYLFCIPHLSLRFGTPAQRRRVLHEYGILFGVYGLLLVFAPAYVLLWGWLAPLVCTGFLINIRGFTQHGITDARDPFLASRSIYPSRLTAFFLLNENLHLEHHLFPEIPSHHLPAVRALLTDRVPRRVTGRSYLGFVCAFLRRTLTLDERPIGLCETPGRPQDSS